MSAFNGKKIHDSCWHPRFTLETGMMMHLYFLVGMMMWTRMGMRTEIFDIHTPLCYGVL